MDEWERFFHDKLVEPQEKAGIKILNAYRTLEDENLFVWSRQFSSKANMAKERAAFYQSDDWKTFRGTGEPAPERIQQPTEPQCPSSDARNAG